MSAHTMRVDWDGFRFPSYAVICHEPPEALCRAVWDCQCEEWESAGVDATGPWHEYAAWSDTEETVRHYGKPGSDDCNYALFIDNSDCADELGHGKVDIPVTFAWDGDGYEWHAGGVS